MLFPLCIDLDCSPVFHSDLHKCSITPSLCHRRHIVAPFVLLLLIVCHWSFWDDLVISGYWDACVSWVMV